MAFRSWMEMYNYFFSKNFANPSKKEFSAHRISHPHVNVNDIVEWKETEVFTK